MRVLWERRENKKGSPGSGGYSGLSTSAGLDPYGKVPRAKVFVLSVLECKSLVEYTGSVYALYERRKEDSGLSGTLGLGWGGDYRSTLDRTQSTVDTADLSTIREDFLEEAGTGSIILHQ